MKLLFAFLMAAALGCAQASTASSACLPTRGTVDNVAYSATVHAAGLFPAFTDLKLNASDPAVVSFQIVVEFQDGSKASPTPYGGNEFLIVGDWCKVARVTISSLVVGSIHQIR